MMDIKNILKDFSRLAEARKNHTFRTRLVFIFCAATIAMVLFFSYRVVNSAMDKILVVNEGGELLRFKAMQQDLLYESLLKNHCYHTAYYLNSFDRLSLQENRARALFLVNKPDANTIFAKYQADRGYGDALELGVVYRTEFEKMLSVSVSGDEYHVTFSSVLSIINGMMSGRYGFSARVPSYVPRHVFRRTLPDFSSGHTTSNTRCHDKN